jgi:hypothetical protein
MFSSGPRQEDEPSSAVCRQEEGKTSSFLLQPDTPVTIVKPAHLKVEYRSNSDVDETSPFFLGGFQLVSNAKHVEVYLTDKEGKETYLMTSKGSMFEKGENGEEWYKAVSVVPGGLRPITMLRVKLLSLKPKDATLAFLQSLKITARIPEGSPQQETEQAPSAAKKAPSPSKIPSLSSKPQASPTKSSPSPTVPNGPTERSSRPSKSRTESSSSSSAQPSSTAALTQQDLGAAMSSLSLMAKNAEDRIENVMCERFAKMEGFLEAKWERMEKRVLSLTSVVISQKTLLGQKLKVMNQQQEVLTAQAEQLGSLSQVQKEMYEKISSLADDMTKMKKVLQLVVDRGETAAATSLEDEKQREAQGDLISEQTGRIDVLIDHQRELQMRVQTLQLQVSDLSQGLQPIIEREEETDAEESRFESVATDDCSDDEDNLMQFPDSDEEKEEASLAQTNTEEDSIQSAPTLSLHEHFATTNNTAKVLKGGGKMDESVPETADMTDIGSFRNVRKIDVNLLDDSYEVKVEEEEELLIPSFTPGHENETGSGADNEVLISPVPAEQKEPPVVLERAPDVLSEDEAVSQEAPSSKKNEGSKKSLSLVDSLRLLRELAFGFASDGHLDLDFVQETSTTNNEMNDDDDDDDGPTTSAQEAGSGLLLDDI